MGVEGTLTQGLRAAGYRTAAFTDEGWVSRKAGFAHGFDHFDEQPGGLGSALRRARRWLSQARGASSFLFVQGAEDSCAESVHAAYEALFCADHAAHADETEPVDRAALSDHYDAGVACADAHLGRLFETLQQLETYDEALIVVTSNYGQALGERGVVGHGGLSPEELLVPLMIRFPAGWKVAARRSDEPVELVDVLPTLFAACGVRVPPDLDGTSLLPIVYRGVRGREFLVAQTTFREGPPPVANLAERAILDPGRWHAVHDARTDRLELFALDGDPQAAVPLEDLGRMEVPGFLKSFFPPAAEPDVEPEPRRPRARSASTAAVRPSLPPSRP